MSVPFTTVDVFTETPFTGNPLAVFTDARSVSAERMVELAREFDYSEITFVLPPDDPDNTARVRIFTPVSEIPFAGHPNVGTAYVLARQGELFGRELGDIVRFEEGVGVVEIRIEREDGQVKGASLTSPGALSVGETLEPSLAARCLGLAEETVLTATHGPTMASVGLPFVMVELSSPVALAACDCDLAAFREADAAYPSPVDHFALYAYTRIGEDRLRARMFAPLDGIPEDPATGSAALALGSFLSSLNPAGALDFQVEQGVEMGRPSLLRVWQDGAYIRLGGRCAEVLKGEVLA